MALSDLASDLLNLDQPALDRFLAAASPQDLDVVEAALEEIDQARRMASAAQWRKGLSARYWDDPVAWAMDNVDWPEGRGLTGYQAECLAMIPERGRVAVRGPHGLGKSALASIATLWFATTRDAAGVDWKVPTTASAWRQLTLYLWPEIHKWCRLLRWDRIGRDPFVRGRELLDLHLKLGFGYAAALASDDPTAIEGAHATELLYVFDESKAIMDKVFDSAEGAFSTAGEDGTNAYALAISTPGEPQGRFYDIHARRPGTEAWWVRHVTLEEAIAAGRVTRSWADQSGRLWGVNSAVYQNRVMGEFAASDEDGVIPLAWVELANERWRMTFGDRQGREVDVMHGTRAVLLPEEKLHTIGVDVARGGSDRTVLALRQGNAIVELRRYAHSNDTMVTAGYVLAVQNGHGDPRAVVDVIGIGAGVFDRVREQRKPCSGFSASEGTKRSDLTGEFGFLALRSWAWWNLREMLDPNLGCDVALPPDDRLTGDLTAPRWKVMSGGRIQVESKDDIRKRLGRSTDDGDAVVQAMSESGGSWADLYRDPPEPDPDIPQPRQKPSRSGGWGNAYRPVSDEERKEWYGQEKPARRAVG